MARRPKPAGYWESLANIETELLTFIADHGTAGVMPKQRTLRAAGRNDLISAFGKHGGAREVARRLGLRMRTRRKPRGYWKKLANIERKVLAFVDENGTTGIMQAQAELLTAGRSDLANAVRRNGGHYAIAKELKLQVAYKAKPAGYWDGPDNLHAEILAFIRQHGVPGVMPCTAELLEHERYDLKYGIEKNGGFRRVAQRLGLRSIRNSNRP